jgi:DNA replication protein DnaC
MHALDLDGMLKRLHLPTVRRLYPECEVRAEAEDQSYRDFLATLIAEEVAHRAQTRIERSVRKARFPFLRSIEDFDFTFQTSVRLQLLGSYLGPELVSEGRSLILCGPTGTGKTHLGIAIAYRAIQNGFEALFTSAAEMIETLSVAVRRGELARTLAHYTHPPVLVIDEVGYLTVGGDAANLMFQVVNERYLHRRPMLFTTNKPLAAWGLVLHDPDLAEAILDRVLERGRLVELRGTSYRTRHLKRVETDRSHGQSPAGISGNHRQDFPEPTSSTARAGHLRAEDSDTGRRMSGQGREVHNIGMALTGVGPEWVPASTSVVSKLAVTRRRRGSPLDGQPLAAVGPAIGPLDFAIAICTRRGAAPSHRTARSLGVSSTMLINGSGPRRRFPAGRVLPAVPARCSGGAPATLLSRARVTTPSSPGGTWRG